MTTQYTTVYTGRKALKRQTATVNAGRQYTEEGDILTVSDAQKRARKKWNDANMKRFAVDLRNEIFDEVEAERKKRGMSRAEVIIDWLKSNSGTPSPLKDAQTEVTPNR